MKLTLLAVAGIAVALLALPALPDDALIPLTLKDHKFAPAEIHVKANAPAQILLTNEDSSSEEFDSSALHVEKVVPGGQKGIVRLRPLAPGRYSFMGEFHSDTAEGVVIAE
ncbi:MAG TPA: cupredoxin domain-containing protein [Rhizomicrobium sp.]|nr:cupredoxin domain-containing protein [Rhizomicrobium sp.]